MGNVTSSVEMNIKRMISHQLHSIAEIEIEVFMCWHVFLVRDLQTIRFKHWPLLTWRSNNKHRDTAVRTKTAVITPSNKVVKNSVATIQNSNLYCILYNQSWWIQNLQVNSSRVNLVHLTIQLVGKNGFARIGSPTSPFWTEPAHLPNEPWAQERKRRLGTYNFNDPHAFYLRISQIAVKSIKIPGHSETPPGVQQCCIENYSGLRAHRLTHSAKKWYPSIVASSWY